MHIPIRIPAQVLSALRDENIPRLLVFPNMYAGPHQATAIPDTDDAWDCLLSRPLHSTNPEDKQTLPAFVGSEFVAGAERKLIRNVARVHALVMDVDLWRPDRPPFTLEEIKERLSGLRFIAYTTYSSSLALLKWRIIVPLAVPMPPERYSAFFRHFNSVILDNTIKDALRDSVRYGYFGAVALPGEYQWHIGAGDRLDWRAFSVPEEPARNRPVEAGANLVQQSHWTPMAQALKEALAAFDDFEVGRTHDRHTALLEAGCKLWWDWAGDENLVRAVLHQVNSKNFAEPKDAEYVDIMVQRAFDRTLGDEAVEQKRPRGIEREPRTRLTLTALEELGKTLKRTTEGDKRITGRVLSAVAAGEVFAEPKEAGHLLTRAVREVAQRFAKEDPTHVLSFFHQSIGAQRSRSAEPPLPTELDLLAQIKDAQQLIVVRQEEARAQQHSAKQRRILAALGNGRTHPYTAAEYEAWEAHGFTDAQWILQQGRSYFFWTGGRYKGPYSDKEAGAHAQTALAPAEKINTSFTAKDGQVKYRTLDELMRSHGSVIQTASVRLYGTGSEYNRADGSLIVSTERLRTLAPEKNADVDTWLRLFAGPKYPQLEAWIANLTSLDVAQAALFLVMPPHSGKNLLAHGLSRLWSPRGGATKLEGFKPHHLEDCPLVFADEVVPSSWTRKFSGQLRGFLSDGKREARRGFSDAYTVLGYPRLIFAGNNAVELFTSDRGSMTASDRKAVESRALLLRKSHTDFAAAQFLQSLGESKCASLIEEDVIAKHALWIRERHKDLITTRFAAASADGDFGDLAVMLNDGTAAILEWVHAHLLRGMFNTEAIRADKHGQLFIHTPTIHTCWEMHDIGRRGIGSGVLQRAVGGVAPDRTQLLVNGARVWYRAMDMALFTTWIELHDHGVDEVLEAISDVIQQKRAEPPAAFYAVAKPTETE